MEFPQHPCIVCGFHVRTRQHAPQCNGCSLWQHRTCNTGVTLAEYRYVQTKVFDKLDIVFLFVSIKIISNAGHKTTFFLIHMPFFLCFRTAVHLGTEIEWLCGACIMEIPIFAAEPDRTDALSDLVGLLSVTEMDTDDGIAHHAASLPPRSPSPLPMDTSFGSFAIPEDYQEESMMLSPPPEVVHAPLAPLTYETIT